MRLSAYGVERGPTPYLWPRCVLEELYRLWPGEYNDTIRSKSTKNNVQHYKDFFGNHARGNVPEDLGLGKNIAQAHITTNFHTNGESSNAMEFVQSVCNHADKKDIDWLQVQGNGISDEYIAETNEARGDLRFAWQALSEAMWPLPSAAEVDIPFGGDRVYEGMALLKHGKAMCTNFMTSDSSTRWEAGMQSRTCFSLLVTLFILT